MGSTCNADITIGGRLRRCCVPALLAALQESEVSPDYGHEYLTEPDELEALLERLRAFAAEHRTAHSPPTFGGAEVSGGNLDAAEAFCQQRGLPYLQHWDGSSGEWSAGNRYWFPGDAAPAETGADDHNEPMLYLWELRKWAGKTVDEALAHYDAIARTVPPLELVDVAPGEACPGCLAETLEPGSSLPEDFPVGAPEAA